MKKLLLATFIASCTSAMAADPFVFGTIGASNLHPIVKGNRGEQEQRTVDFAWSVGTGIQTEDGKWSAEIYYEDLGMGEVGDGPDVDYTVTALRVRRHFGKVNVGLGAGQMRTVSTEPVTRDDGYRTFPATLGYQNGAFIVDASAYSRDAKSIQIGFKKVFRVQDDLELYHPDVPVPVVAAQPPQKVVEKIEEVRVGQRTMFDHDSYQLGLSEHEQLMEVAVLVKEYDLKLMVVGSASQPGSREYNLKLSQKRADEVVEALREMGVTSEMVTVAEGEDSPIYPLSEDHKNRHVRFLVIAID